MLLLTFVSAFAVLPTDPRVALIGRFDRTDPANVACQWPASEVRLRVSGDSLTATLEETGRDLWQIVVDGAPRAVLAPHAGVGEYRIDLGGPGVHDVGLVKRTEAFVGTTRFRSFVASQGFLQARARAKTIEFVGDSITCGYGIEGASEKAHFLPETENAYMTYASLTGRALDADVRLIAWSGRKMWPDNTMPEIYDRILPTQPAPLAAEEPAPAAVVIALATNDFARSNPNEGAWTGAYEGFVRRVWGKYPKARVYVALGSMMTDDYPKGTKALSSARGQLTRMVARIGDPRLRFVEFDTQRMEDGIGSDWHPNLATHRKMAARLVEALKKDLDL